MTKLNHNRPSLRYLDNLRRELRREDRPAPSWFNPGRIEKFGVQFTEPAAYPSYILEFGKLDSNQQRIAGCAIEAFGAYLESSISVIALVMGGKAKAKAAAKQAQKAAHERFVVSGAVLVASIIQDMAAGRHGFWRWFQDFYAGLDRRSKFTWSEFGQTLIGESLQLWFAQQLADAPEAVARWREVLSREDWE